MLLLSLVLTFSLGLAQGAILPGKNTHKLKMARYFQWAYFHLQSKYTGYLLIFMMALIFQTGCTAEAVSFDDDCSQVQCPTETALCPPDSVLRQPPAVVDVLYGPDEFLPPREFYDDVENPADVMEQHYDELPLHVNADTAPTNASMATATTPSATTTTTKSGKGVLTEVLESKKDFKRELIFDNKNIDDVDEYERLLEVCCTGIAKENPRRRRRLRRSSVADDCECKPCDSIPQCPTGEVAIKLHEAAGSPGDCCPRYACATKPVCGSAAEAQTYWRDACTRCSCYGAKGMELCHNECPETEQQQTERSCYSNNLQEPQLHASEWYENHFCTKCRCENGVRECVESLCKPVACSNPVKVEGQCCPQCPAGVEDILIAHENSTDASISNSTNREQRLLKETTTVSSLIGGSSMETTTASTLSTTEPSTTFKATTESSLELIGVQSQATSTESTTTTLVYSSTTQTSETSSSTTEIWSPTTQTSETSSSTTEIWSPTRRIDDIAADGYFGPNTNFTLEGVSSTTQETVNDLSESSSESSLTAQTSTSSSRTPSQMEFTELSSTSPEIGTSSKTLYTEYSTEESSTTTQSTKELSTTCSTLTVESTSAVATVVLSQNESSTASSTETPATNSTTESTTPTNSSETSEASTPHLASTTTSATTASSSSPTTASTTAASTASTTAASASSPDTFSPATDSSYSYTASPSVTLSTPTTSSPYSSTASTQPATTFVYWYTFSTSAPSPPIPQPTVYQPSVRTFFTRPEVRYIGATAFVAFLAICALAVWKFCMPTRSVRLKNRYRTVPSSEATSLSHSPTTSHSSMA